MTLIEQHLEATFQEVWMREAQQREAERLLTAYRYNAQGFPEAVTPTYPVRVIVENGVPKGWSNA